MMCKKLGRRWLCLMLAAAILLVGVPLPAAEAAEVIYTSPYDAAVELRAGMVARQPETIVHYRLDERQTAVNSDTLTALCKEIFYAALEHTGNPKEGDYLAHVWDSCGFSVSDTVTGTVHELAITFSLTYHTTAEQEEEMDQAVTELMEGFNFGYDDPAYKKAEVIYDYICQNVVYDYDNLNNEDNTLKYSAYAALINGTAVCQGYATLLYRLLLEAGVDNRVITGEAGGENHAWNIVKMENLYYNADSTWDAITGDRTYFLRSDVSVSDHTRHKDYADAQFMAAYPMGESDYVYTPPHIHSLTETATPPTCTEEGYTTYSCVCGYSYTDNPIPALGHHWDEGAVTTPPTETEEGVRTFTCTLCGDTYTEPVAPMGHTHSYTDTVTPPTCTEEGYTTHSCVCGHSYTDNPVPALGHHWDEGAVTTPPTETEEGVRTFTCTLCGDTYTEPVLPTGHTHSYTDTVTPPTCTEEGYTTHSCACGHSYTDSKIPATGHVFGDWFVARYPGCETQGLDVRICDLCGEREERYSEPLGHILVKDEAVEPTCYTAGYTEGQHCSRCNMVTVPQERIPWLQHDMKDGICTLCGYTDKEPEGDYYMEYAGCTAQSAMGEVYGSVPGELSVWDGDRKVSGNDKVSTGMVIRVTHNGVTTDAYTIVIVGDVNGDGQITITDMLAIKAHLLNKTPLEGAAYYAADITFDRQVSITDFIRVKSHILGKTVISQKYGGAL